MEPNWVLNLFLWAVVYQGLFCLRAESDVDHKSQNQINFLSVLDSPNSCPCTKGPKTKVNNNEVVNLCRISVNIYCVHLIEGPKTNVKGSLKDQ